MDEPSTESRPRRRSLVTLLAIATATAVTAVAFVVTRDGAESAAVSGTTTTTAAVTTTTAAVTATTTTVATPPPTTTVPPPAVPASTNLASPLGEVATYDAAGGHQIGKVGQWYGYPMTMPIVEEQGDWLRIMLPERPNGATAWVRADQVSRGTSPWRMVVKLSETRVYVYKDGFEQWSAPLGIGRDTTRTPIGSFFVAVIENPGEAGYGPIVLDLNAHSEDIQSWQGSGDAITAFHGPFGSEQLLRAGGGKVSNGCLRMLPEDQIKMYGITLGTPVDIVA